MDNDLSEEAIQKQMQETRASLAEKLETLENKVIGTVENATASVSETVGAIKETVQETVSSVQVGVRESVDNVKEFFDVPAQVQRRPWMMLGGSVAIGYLLGSLLSSRERTEPQQVPLPPRRMTTYPETGNGVKYPQMTQPPPQEVSSWGPEVEKLKGLALGVLFGTARELIASSVPEHMGEHVKGLVDSVTKKVGGEPLPSSDWNQFRETVEAGRNDHGYRHDSEPDSGSNFGNRNQYPSA